jgi:hypothetical protein
MQTNEPSVIAPSFYVDEVHFVSSEKKERRTGLLGFVSFRINRGLRIDGVSLRRTRNGDHALSFPGRRSLAGYEFPYVRPLDDRTRREIEAQVFAALGIEGVPK